jgi:hypothetical protein
MKFSSFWSRIAVVGRFLLLRRRKIWFLAPVAKGKKLFCMLQQQLATSIETRCCYQVLQKQDCSVSPAQLAVM